MATLYFHGGTDWNTAGNWWLDSGYTMPAGTPPSAGDTVYLESAVHTGPASAISLAALYLASANYAEIDDAGAGISTTGDLTVGSQSSNSSSGTSANSGSNSDSSTQKSPLLFGNVKITTQTSSEVTTLGYEITGHLAARVADGILRALPPVSIDAKDGSVKGYQILVVNDKTTADRIRAYRTILSQIAYLTDQGVIADQIFQSQTQRPSTIKLNNPTQTQIDAIDNINATLQAKGYPPSYLISKDQTLQKRSTSSAIHDAVLSSAASHDETLTPKNTAPGPLSYFDEQLNSAKLSGAFAGITSESTVSALLDAAGTAPASGGTASIPTGYLVPYIGQAQASVDALTGLGQSLAKFYSLFRTNDEINGVSLKIPTEALTAMVIKRLRLAEAARHQIVHCYYSDLLAEDNTSSGVLTELDSLQKQADLVSKDLAKVNSITGNLSPDTDGTPPKTVTGDDGTKVISAYGLFAQTAPNYTTQAANPASSNPKTDNQNQSPGKNGSSPLQSLLQTYETTVTQFFVMIYGGSSSGKTGAQNPGDTTDTNGNSTKNAPPGVDFSGTNMNQNVAAPVTIIPTMSPQITLNTGGALSSGTTAGGTESGKQSANAGAANSAGASGGVASSQSGGSSTSSSSTAPPLATILQDEEIFNLRAGGYVLYLNILSSAGANETVNGWWSSDVLTNAGVALDYFLVEPSGEILDSSAEDGQSPYLPLVDRDWAERLPTIVTTNKGVKTKTDVWESDDTEPQSRFTVTPVTQQSADSEDDSLTSDSSGQSSKPRR